MSTIILVRHGHVAGIDPPCFRGRADLALTERGQDEARRVAKRIADVWSPVMIYTSPRRRCVDTGRAIADACNIRSQILTDVDDLDYGTWQGRTWDEARGEDPALLEAWFDTPDQVGFPGGESLQDVAARVARALRVLYARHIHETIVLVSHDGVNRVILALILNTPLSSYWRLIQEPCCINEIEHDCHGARVRHINDTAHLRV